MRASYICSIPYQVDVACGKHGVANGIGPGKGCYI